MTRKSFQRVTLSVELTLPPGGKPVEAPVLLRQSLQHFLQCEEHLDGMTAFPASLKGLSWAATVIKITKRETIYP